MTSARLVALAGFVVLATSSARASAQPVARPTVVLLQCTPPVARALDVELLARRIATLAEVTVVAEAEPSPPLPLLTVAARTRRRAHVTLRWPTGREVARTVELPEEPEERIETIALLAVNLLRDESAEVLALLRPGETGPIEGVSPPEETGPEETVPVEGGAPEEPPEDAAEAPTGETSVVTPEETVALPPQSARPDAPGPAFLRIGASLHFGSVPRGTGLEVDLMYGVELSWTAPELVAIGVRELAVGGLANGNGLRVDLAPFAELGATLDVFTFYGQVGLHLQLAAPFDGPGVRFGVAPLGVAGARVRVIREMSIGLETALRVVLTDSLGTPLHELPQFTLPWTVGLAVLFHVS